MSDVRPYLWLIPALPLAASILTAFLGPRLLRRQSHWPCVLAAAVSCVLSFFVLAAVFNAPHEPAEGPVHDKPPEIRAYYSWIPVEAPPGSSPEHSLNIGFQLRADPLTAMMLVMITFIGSWIAIYSIGYMHGDEGYARFFAEVSLFLFMMTTLVLADNFVVLYLGWEGVGLCSYLL